MMLLYMLLSFVRYIAGVYVVVSNLGGCVVDAVCVGMNGILTCCVCVCALWVACVVVICVRVVVIGVMLCVVRVVVITVWVM